MEHTGDPAAAGESARDDGDPLTSGLVRLTVLALIGGALTGLVGGLFRLALAGAELLRTDVLEWAREAPAVRWVLPVILAAGAAALARLIVRWDPDASGSGVQRVEAVVRGQLEPDRRLRLIPAKFVGGVLAIGSGMALGREGPTVQMGASIGQEIARVTRLSAQDRGSLTASLGGAGLGVAFSAPLGGAVFVFEELTREFRTRLVVAVLAGTATAMAVSHYLVGWDAVFPVPSVETGAMWQLIVYAAFGLVVGLLGVAYNRLVLLLLDAFASVHRLPPEVKAGLVGALVGLLGVAAPLAVGSGEVLNEKVLLGGVPLGALLLLLLVRWLLGPLSYATGTPGGLFAPLLLVGAALGALVAGAMNALLPGDPLPVLGLTIVGMSTFFTAVVRAPLTGVVLIVEMTATTSLLVPMMIAAGAAVLSATLVKGPPIYDTLRERLGTQA